MIIQAAPENTESDLELMETKEVLNDMAHENDQLKVAIARERYGPRQVPVEAKQQLNILQNENDELKSEVRRFRYVQKQIYLKLIKFTCIFRECFPHSGASLVTTWFFYVRY